MPIQWAEGKKHMGLRHNNSPLVHCFVEQEHRYPPLRSGPVKRRGLKASIHTVWAHTSFTVKWNETGDFVISEICASHGHNKVSIYRLYPKEDHCAAILILKLPNSCRCGLFHVNCHECELCLTRIALLPSSCKAHGCILSSLPERPTPVWTNWKCWGRDQGKGSVLNLACNYDNQSLFL